MSDVKWIKISTNIFDDEKIKLIETLPDSDTLIIIWFKLLSMAGRCNDSGMIYLTRDVPYNEEMLSTIMRRPVNTVRLAMNEFQKLGMIHIVNNYIAILNWEKHQTLDKYEIVKEQNRKRKQVQREKLKEITHNSNVTGQSRDVTQEIRLDKTRKEKKEKTPEEKELFHFVESLFKSNNTSYYPNAKENSNIHHIVQRLKTKTEIEKLFKIFKSQILLRHDRYWSGQPLIPSAMQCNIDRLYKIKSMETPLL